MLGGGMIFALLALGLNVRIPPPLPSDTCGFYFGAKRAACDACMSNLAKQSARLGGIARQMAVLRVVVG
jgi:hypothetical protein